MDMESLERIKNEKLITGNKSKVVKKITKLIKNNNGKYFDINYEREVNIQNTERDLNYWMELNRLDEYPNFIYYPFIKINESGQGWQKGVFVEVENNEK